MGNKRVFSVRGGNCLDERLERFARGEFYRSRSLDPDLLAGLRIDAGASLARCNPEGSKSHKLHALGFLDACLDCVDDGIHGPLRLRFAGSKSFLDGGDKFDFIHVSRETG